MVLTRSRRTWPTLAPGTTEALQPTRERPNVGRAMRLQGVCRGQLGSWPTLFADQESFVWRCARHGIARNVRG